VLRILIRTARRVLVDAELWVRDEGDEKEPEEQYEPVGFRAEPEVGGGHSGTPTGRLPKAPKGPAPGVVGFGRACDDEEEYEEYGFAKPDLLYDWPPERAA
jgi:hypothetical protein